MSQKPPPKQFVKTPINGTKFVILVSSAKGGVGKSADNGNPLTRAEPNHEVSVIFKSIAKKIKDSCL